MRQAIALHDAAKVRIESSRAIRERLATEFDRIVDGEKQRDATAEKWGEITREALNDRR